MNEIFVTSQHFFGIVLIFLLAGCAPVVASATSTRDARSIFTPAAPTVEAQIKQTAASKPTTTISPTIYPTAIPWSVATGSPVPTLAGILMPDAVQVEKWKEYEDALAKALFPTGTILKHAHPDKKFLCEWEFLGKTDQKVYVWADCMSTPSLYESETLAVIHINRDGAIQSVETPRAGSYSQDIHKLFPLDVQKMYFDRLIDFRRLSDHLRMRITHPEEPPLSVHTATPMP
jgi:hypothetical protein